jgi:hypothetical protein
MIAMTLLTRTDIKLPIQLEAAETTTEAGNCTQFDFTCVCKASNLWQQYLEGVTAEGIVSCNQTESQGKAVFQSYSSFQTPHHLSFMRTL